MRFYKGTDQYVVAVTAREEVSLFLHWVAFGLGWVEFGSWTLRNIWKKHWLELANSAWLRNGLVKELKAL